MVLKAPYNFVPLNSKVVSPMWEADVNHDLPFSDGESGIIALNVTAASPVFIRNAHTKDEITADFSNFKNKFFIPGTSIKGTIKNILEIISFSAMSPVNNDKYSFRDLSSSHGAYLKAFREIKPECGWLSKDENGDWTIESCGEPGRISHKELDEKLETGFSQRFQKALKTDHDKTARYKYELFENKKRSMNFSDEIDSCQRRIGAIDESGPLQGTIVFTGQPGPRNEKRTPPTGKHLEFVFFNINAKPQKLDTQVKKDFLFAYFDGEEGKESEDWAYWKTKLDLNEKIPIFFRKKEKVIIDMGLSYLYKLPYKKRIVDCLPDSHKKEIPGVADTILGHIKGKNPLKGRVQFSHAFAVGDPDVLYEKREVLAGPKASYLPTYLTHENNAKYTDYNDNGAQIKGWKRYPVHLGNTVLQNRPENVSGRVFTSFIPLAAGTQFLLKVRIHNLRKIEIGALLSAITFHNTNNCYHSLGMGKPLGYGKISVSIANMDNLKYSLEEYLKAFEWYMELETGNNESWHDSPLIRELLTMASEQSNQEGMPLSYMSLEEHKRAKQNKERLSNYSEFEGVAPISPVSFLSDEDKIVINKERKKKLIEKNNHEHIEKLQLGQPIGDQRELNTWISNGKNLKVAKILETKVKKQKSNKQFTNIYKTLAEFLDIDLIAGKVQKKTEGKSNQSSSNSTPGDIKEKARKFLAGDLDSFSGNDLKKLKRMDKKLARKISDRIRSRDKE